MLENILLDMEKLSVWSIQCEIGIYGKEIRVFKGNFDTVCALREE